MPKRPKTRRNPWVTGCNRRADQRRGTASDRGYDGRWRKARLAFLSQPENVLCRLCTNDGRQTLATLIDHIEPHGGDPNLFWDRSNWQPLCYSCHSHKTAAEDGGFGNTKPRKDDHAE